MEKGEFWVKNMRKSEFWVKNVEKKGWMRGKKMGKNPGVFWGHCREKWLKKGQKMVKIILKSGFWGKIHWIWKVWNWFGVLVLEMVKNGEKWV